MIRTTSRSTSTSSASIRIVGDDDAGLVLIAMDQRVDRVADRHFGKAAHLGDQAAKLADLVLE